MATVMLTAVKYTLHTRGNLAPSLSASQVWHSITCNRLREPILQGHSNYRTAGLRALPLSVYTSATLPLSCNLN